MSNKKIKPRLKIYTEMNLNNFEFWGIAQDNVAILTEDEITQVTAFLAEINPNGLTEEEVNDIFGEYFDEVVLEHLGIDEETRREEMMY